MLLNDFGAFSWVARGGATIIIPDGRTDAATASAAVAAAAAAAAPPPLISGDK